MNWELFFIIIMSTFIFLLVAALVLWVLDSRMDYKRKKMIAKKVESGKGLRVEDDNLILKIQDGNVEILEELPVLPPISETEKEEKDSDSVLVPMQDEMAVSDVLVAEKKEKLEELVSRYGEITDNSVVFETQKNQKLSFIEKYASLTAEMRAYYDDVVAYILANKDCKKIESFGAITFKCKTDKILRAVIKRDAVVLNFMLANTDLNRFVREEGIKKIKITPVAIRLESDADVILAKQTADITLENIREEQQYRKDKKRELRRLKREQEKNQK